MYPTISIVIVNWNSGNMLYECITSVFDHEPLRISKIIVVDNGSKDNSCSKVEKLDKVQLIQANENLGFAKACNLGASFCNTDYLLFLNPDTKLVEPVIQPCLDFIVQNNKGNIGTLGVKLVDDAGAVQHSCSYFPSIYTYVGRIFNLTGLFPSIFPTHYMHAFDHLSNREVDQVMGAFFLVNSSLFDILEGFDEDFFVYQEDVDFALRSRQTGWQNWHFSKVTVYHKGGGTSGQVKAHRLFYSLRSRVIYAFKHFSAKQAWFLLILTVVFEPFSRILRALLRLSPKEFIETIHAYSMFYRALFNILNNKQRAWTPRLFHTIDD